MKSLFEIIDKNDIAFFVIVFLIIMTVAILQVILWGKREDWETCKNCGGLSNYLTTDEICQDCVEDLV